jgi:CelD/BcsL family acetyltransferase involved in cellulose biosynthesis/biotin carboxylase
MAVHRPEDAMTAPIAIVDPYDAGTLLAATLRERGSPAVLVASTPDMASEGTRFDPADFRRLLFWRDDFAGIVADLRAEGISHVLAGSERGVILADRLAEALDLPGNGTGLSLARRDKYLMIGQAARHGVRTPRQFQSDELDAILDWIETEGGWPAILKPRRAIGSEGVRLCVSRRAAAEAFSLIHGLTDRLGNRNDTVLAQEYLHGREYVVDTVSRDGRHRLAGLWVYGKPPAAYDTVGLLSTKRLLPARGPLADRLFDFAIQVLDALGIRHGAGHCELILDERGPALVEMGARLHGGPPAHLMSRAATGDSQCDLLMRSCLAPADFLAEADRRYELESGAAMALLRDPSLKGEIEELPSAQRIVWNGNPAPPPAVAGLATLIHPDPAEIETDLEIVTGRLPCEILDSREAVAAIAPAWRALLERSRCNRAFSGPSWYLAALEVQPDLEPRLVAAYRDGALAGLLPLAWDGARQVVRFASDLSDYNDVVASAHDRPAARRLMALARGRFPALELACVRPDAACALAEGRPARLTDRKVPCPYVDISAGYEDWLASRSRSFRANLGQMERRAAARGLTVERLDPRGPERDLPALFLELQRQRFGERSLFARNPTAAAFVRRALPTLFEAGDALIFALRAGEDLVGLNICMVGADSLGYWNAGFRPDFAPFSPGALMMHAGLREARARGLAEFDLLRGPEAYKMKWCTGIREIGRLS